MQHGPGQNARRGNGARNDAVRTDVCARAHGAIEEPLASDVVEAPAHIDFSPPSVRMSKSLSSAPGCSNEPSVASVQVRDSASSTGGAHSARGSDATLEPTIQELLHENATLKEAFSEANRRLARLEEEKSRFFDEGVFDLVNSVCGQSGSTRSYGDLVARLRGLAGFEPSPKMSLQLPLSPTRSENLGKENAKLRRELARATELGETLEQQQRAVEDRAHALEQERAFLADRLTQCATTVGTIGNLQAIIDGGTGATVADSAALASSTLDAIGVIDLDIRHECESTNRVLCGPVVAGNAAGVPNENWSPRCRLEAAAAAEAEEERALLGQAGAEALERQICDTEDHVQTPLDQNSNLETCLGQAAIDNMTAECARCPVDDMSGVAPESADSGSLSSHARVVELDIHDIEEAW